MKPNLEPPHNNDMEKDIYMDESNCSTPYVSAPSSPGRSYTLPPPPPTTTTTITAGFYYSAPTSPMHYILTSSSTTSPTATTTLATATSDASSAGSFEFEFSSRFNSFTTPSSPAAVKPLTPPTMSSADELFLNGQIRPMKLSSLLQHPQTLPPISDAYDSSDVIFHRSRDLRMRSRSQHRRARSMSPLRCATPFEWTTLDDVTTTTTPEKQPQEDNDVTDNSDPKEGSTSSSRCSSAGRSSKRWVFLKDFLRSKSEGRSNNKFWHNLSLKEKKVKDGNNNNNNVKGSNNEGDKSGSYLGKKSPGAGGKGAVGKGKRRSAHEMHYTANRAQAEEMRKKTYLPYRQGLLGCLGFNSKSYGALHGFARALNPVSST